MREIRLRGLLVQLFVWRTDWLNQLTAWWIASRYNIGLFLCALLQHHTIQKGKHTTFYINAWFSRGGHFPPRKFIINSKPTMFFLSVGGGLCPLLVRVHFSSLLWMCPLRDSRPYDLVFYFSLFQEQPFLYSWSHFHGSTIDFCPTTSHFSTYRAHILSAWHLSSSLANSW